MLSGCETVQNNSISSGWLYSGICWSCVSMKCQKKLTIMLSEQFWWFESLGFELDFVNVPLIKEIFV